MQIQKKKEEKGCVLVHLSISWLSLKVKISKEAAFSNNFEILSRFIFVIFF